VVIEVKTDREVQKDVMDALRWEPDINETNIGVAVNDGVVTLSGNVDSYMEKVDAERAAARVRGVKAVVQEIKVKLLSSYECSDEELARATVSALEWDVLIPKDRVKVLVQDGRVTLKGEVDWRYQKEEAENIVCCIRGVRAVNNELIVKPPPSVKPQDVKAKIEGALQRNAILDAHQIKVETEGSKVILSGTVRSWAEKEQARRAAWSAPGVTQVEDNIMVRP
jgi:osmotically-inducible protein OsmY